MKHLFLTIAIVLLGLPMVAQEVHFPSSIVAAGGSSEGSSVNLSRWRLAPVHVFTLKGDNKVKSDLKSQALPVQDWNVSIYPNPVEDFLYLDFELQEQKELLLKITDFTGRIMFIQEARTFLNGSTIELNISHYSPGLYLLQVASPDLSSQKVFNIIKL